MLRPSTFCLSFEWRNRLYLKIQRRGRREEKTEKLDMLDKTEWHLNIGQKKKETICLGTSFIILKAIRFVAIVYV